MTKDTLLHEPWLKWAMEIQSIAQCGLTYSESGYDLERYERLRDISAEMLSYKADIPVDKIKSIFFNEKGYLTPKLDTRAAVFKDGKILLVHEKNNTWSLPGGWVDVLESIGSNTVKEVKEESGLDVKPKKIIAIQDRKKHNLPVYAFGVCKVFVLCDFIGGTFAENIETTGYDYYTINDLPLLAEEKCTKEQIHMCFKANENENWITFFD